MTHGVAFYSVNQRTGSPFGIIDAFIEGESFRFGPRQFTDDEGVTHVCRTTTFRGRARTETGAIEEREFPAACSDDGRFLLASRQGGAVEEALADIFGVSAGFFHEQDGATGSYELGVDLAYGVIRSLSDPTARRYPGAYRDRIEFAFFCVEDIDGDCYRDFSGASFIRGRYHTTYDRCCYGANHWNSTILSHAFYLAVEGGTNLATGHAVEGVGAADRAGDRGHLLPRADGARAGGRDTAASRGGPSAGRGRPAPGRQRALPGGGPGAARGGTLTCSGRPCTSRRPAANRSPGAAGEVGLPPNMPRGGVHPRAGCQEYPADAFTGHTRRGTSPRIPALPRNVPMTIPSRTTPLALPSIVAGVAVLTLAGPPPVVAESATGTARAFITVNGGVQSLTSGFSGNVVFPESGSVYRLVLSGAAAQEQAHFESDHRFEPGPLFDIGGGIRVWSYLAVGVGVSRFRTEETAAVSGQVPHPFFFDRYRSIAGASPLLARSEWAVHLQALATVPASRSFAVTVFGGPTFFSPEQQLVTDVSSTQAYAFDTATFSSASVDHRSGSTLGFHVGADVAYYFTDTVGVGWLTRYSRGRLELPSVDGDSLELETGGLHAAWGLRMRF